MRCLSSIHQRQLMTSELWITATKSQYSLSLRFFYWIFLSHSDKNQKVAWSCSALYGTPLLSVLPLTEEERIAIEVETRQKAENIIKVKGFTSYGVAAATSRICESIIFDQRQILTISHWQEDFNCCLSIPTVVGRAGVVRPLPLQINEHEMGLLKKSAESLKIAMENVEKNMKSEST